MPREAIGSGYRDPEPGKSAVRYRCGVPTTGGSRLLTTGQVAKKTMLIGLDCAEPSLVERWRDELPTLSGLMDRGVHGRLTSIVPPITVPAWSCMMASRTPGDLGIYGFRNRADRSYDALFVADGTAVREPRLWDLIGRAGGSSIVVGVPGTYPPRPLRGVMVSCFLTPSLESTYTFPPGLRDEVAAVVGEYLFDCTNFRTNEKDDLLRQVYEMTDRRFALAEHLLETRPWELFALVEMGTDRIHHGFWKELDAEHRGHVPGGRHEHAIRDYYRHVDGLIGRILRFADDETVVMVVSDHGAKRLEGGIRINEWLRREGLLATLRELEDVCRPADVGIDWSKTVAWGDGGYYARIFMNVEGREPNGVVPAAEYEETRDELARRIEAIPDDRGAPMATRAYKPEELYPQVNGVPPDLIVIFDDLLWRSVGTIGGPEGIHTFENDTGPDDANHAQDGLFIVAGAGVEARGESDGHLLDIAPTVLELLGHEVPEEMRGHSMADLLTTAGTLTAAGAA
jgi:predicted AlkP superfamily phosphohydrolase/phosphomutase